MRFLSKKEVAKHRALAHDHDFDRFKQMDLKNENEISVKDLASDDEDKKYDDSDIRAQSEDEAGEGIDDIYEFWEESEKKRIAYLKEKNPNVDLRLEEYLRSHSQQLSLHVQ